MNSHLTRKGNFGVRAMQICSALEEENIHFYCMSRGGGKNNTKYFNFQFFGLIARFLNLFRLKVFPNFNHRKYEKFFFELLVLSKLRNLNIEGNIIHLWEYSEKIIDYAHSRRAKVILEVPNVTQNYIYQILSSKRDLALSFFEKQMLSEKGAIERADLVVVPSQFVMDSACELSPNTRYELIPFGFPPVNLKQTFVASERALRLLFVGNVDERKGVPTIIEALRLIPEFKCEVRLVGRLGALQKKTLQQDIRIKYLGFGDPTEHYRWADIFVFPTWCEGSAKVVYEAMSYGLAVLTTPSSGSLIKHNEDGILFNPGDSKMLSKHLINLSRCRSSIARIGEKARITAEKRPWNKYTSDIMQIYKEFS